jgi:hypothetical protein
MDIYLNGRIEKSILLSNQQETLIKESSETDTQSISYKKFINSVKPDHIKSYNNEYLNWFVGFSEGDGNFIINYKNNKISFIISQKDPKVLFNIKKNLGFGKVSLCKDKYYRFIVSQKQNLWYLIKIFSSKLILNKTNLRYYNWINSYIIYYKLNKHLINFKFKENEINIKTSWLSGFIDAEACFDAPQRLKRLSFRMRFSIKQKSEYEVFSRLPYIWQLNTKYGHLIKKKDIIIFCMDSLKTLKYLINYLKIYKLKSNKNITYNKWLKLYRVLEDGKRGKDYDTIKKMSQDINKYEIEDTVQ